MEATNPKMIAAVQACAKASAQAWIEAVDCEQWQDNAKEARSSCRLKEPLHLELGEGDYIALAKLCLHVDDTMDEDAQQQVVEAFEEAAQAEWKKALEKSGYLTAFDLPGLGEEYEHWTGAGVYTCYANDCGGGMEHDEFFVSSSEHGGTRQLTYRKNGDVWERECQDGWAKVTKEYLSEAIRSNLEYAIEEALEAM